MRNFCWKSVISRSSLYLFFWQFLFWFILIVNVFSGINLTSSQKLLNRRQDARNWGRYKCLIKHSQINIEILDSQRNLLEHLKENWESAHIISWQNCVRGVGIFVDCVWFLVHIILFHWENFWENFKTYVRWIDFQRECARGELPKYYQRASRSG